MLRRKHLWRCLGALESLKSNATGAARRQLQMCHACPVHLTQPQLVPAGAAADLCTERRDEFEERSSRAADSLHFPTVPSSCAENLLQ